MFAVRPTLIVFLLALLAVKIPARVIQPEEEIFNPTPVVRQARQQSTATITILKTTTISSVFTTTITTKKTCGILASVSDGGTLGPGDIATFTTTPAAACSRRRRQYWDQPVFVALKNDDDNLDLQYYRLNPSQVLSFEPTVLPQFRHVNNKKPSNMKYLIKDSLAEAIQPSFDGIMGPSLRSPVFGGAINSLISSIVSNILTTTTTTTSISTVFTSTSSITSYTATASFYVVGVCYPSGLNIC